jgi:glycosyltransferase involved in cell wall biosynthesis
MATPIRTLFLIPSLVANGAERQLYELARSMDPERFEVHLVVFYDPGPEENLWDLAAKLPDVHLHSLHKRRGLLGYLTAMPRLLGLILSTRAQVLHGYMDGNLPLLLLGRLLGKRVVWGIRRTSKDQSRNTPMGLRLLRAGVRLSRYVDLIIFNSEAGRTNHAAMGMCAARMEVVVNGFDVDRFRPDPEGGAAQRAAWGVAPEVPLIGIVGRFNPVKDHPTFLRAAARVARSSPSARFVCVGEGPGPYLASLRELAASLGIADRVLFPAGHLGMTAAYNALSLLVLSSTDEGFPNVLGEAMACGVPCVTTRVGDAEALVGPLGVAVEAGDDQGIADGLAALLAEPPAARAARAEASRARICEMFSVTALARNTERLLASLVAPEAVATAPAATSPNGDH